jgi:hypothetical protein
MNFWTWMSQNWIIGPCLALVVLVGFFRLGWKALSIFGEWLNGPGEPEEAEEPDEPEVEEPQVEEEPTAEAEPTGTLGDTVPKPDPPRTRRRRTAWDRIGGD